MGALDIFKNRDSSMKRTCEEKEMKGLMRWSKVHEAIRTDFGRAEIYGALKVKM